MKNIIVIVQNDFKSNEENYAVEKKFQCLPKDKFSIEFLSLTTILPAIEFRNESKITRMFHPKLVSNPFSKEATNSYYQGVDYITKKHFDIIHCIGSATWHIGAGAKKKDSAISLTLESETKHSERKPWSFANFLLNIRKRKSLKRADFIIQPYDNNNEITIETRNNGIIKTDNIQVYLKLYSTFL
jgi:hypothetical protein